MSRNCITPKQKRFCEEYARLGVGEEAARRAGYKGDGTVLRAMSTKNLRLPVCREYLRELGRVMAAPTIAEAKERREFLTRVMRGEEKEKIFVDGKFIDAPPKLVERLRASDQLNKMDCSYVQKVDIGGALPVVLVDDVPEDDEDE